MSALAALLPDGRLHLQHGPIDCLCQAWGDPTEIHAAYNQAATFFGSVLTDLCAELPLLRQKLPAARPRGAIARTMHDACAPFTDCFITPMAAVAGAVADAVLAAMVQGRAVSRGFVNNGGDIAFHLRPGTSLRCGLISDISPASIHAALIHPQVPDHRPPERNRPDAGLTLSPLDGTFLLTASQPARGIATSGRACKGQGGRSFSFGIADSVSILARTAAQADAAATIIGNAVDLPGHPAIDRRPASGIDPASDLGDRRIAFSLGHLTGAEIHTALDAGETMADKLLRAGLIDGAVLALRGHIRVRHPSPELA